MNGMRVKNQKLLRCGYTTGSCAAAAAKAAAHMLLSQSVITSVSIVTPNGTALTLDVCDARVRKCYARCAIRKDSGDDPDITNGVLVYATVRYREAGMELIGGAGVGRVTKPGLDQPVGASAINRVPREMIVTEVSRICLEHRYTGGMQVIVSIPEGLRLYQRTFNPHLGIAGGLSILGTSGIVEPMSEAALADTIALEVSVLKAQGEQALLMTIGNYGETFAKESLALSLRAHVKCSNFLGDAIDAACAEGFSRILVVGHIGKLVKLGIGMMNTHSRYGDGRMETLVACALEAGAHSALLLQILDCVSTDAALMCLEEAGLLRPTMDVLQRRIEGSFRRRVLEHVEIGFVCFTNWEHRGIVCESDNAHALMALWRES